MKCPNCNSDKVRTSEVTEWFDYGEIQRAFQATFPVMTCADCTFGWRDSRSEDAIETAMQDYVAHMDDENLEKFKTEIREAFQKHWRPGTEKSPYEEALIMLAAEI